MADNEEPDLFSQPVTLFEITAVETDLMRVAAALRYFSLVLDPGNLDGTKKILYDQASKELNQAMKSILSRWKFRKDPDLSSIDLDKIFKN